MGQRDVVPDPGVQVFITPAGREPPAVKPASLQVLVVEDDADVRTLLRLALRLDGHRVIEATTPEDGLPRAVGARPDLIVLDVKFPHGDGISALRKLRQTEKTMDVPVILVSGKAEVEDQIRGLEEGADFYLVKPFDPLVFLAMVEQLARISAGERAERRAKELERLRAFSS